MPSGSGSRVPTFDIAAVRAAVMGMSAGINFSSLREPILRHAPDIGTQQTPAVHSVYCRLPDLQPHPQFC
jgi:hypothetical protein